MKAARPAAWSGLPAGLIPPVKVALARAVPKMPRAGLHPGTLLYEPKWDGFRAIGIRDDNGGHVVVPAGEGTDPVFCWREAPPC